MHANSSMLVESMQSQYPTKAAKGYFVTLEEPTAEQRDAVKRIAGDRVASLSFAQLRRFMIDASSYLAARIEYPFGSMYDIETESYTAPSGLITPELTTSDGEVLRIIDVRRMLEEGQSIVLVGDYGAGKSTTLRELFVALRARYFTSHQQGRFPVHLNLRDHHGQTHPAEALERHARNIGFPSPHHLVRAWNAGYLTLLLDGFDEFATVGWSGQAKRLRAIRYESMELIRNFMRGSANTGIIIAGREHYFDSARELSSSLGLRSNAKRLYISDFTDAQIREFLAKKGWTEGIPDWLPSRPLLLSYLFARRMLEQVMAVDYGINPAAGWDVFLDLTTERESQIGAGIDGETVRRILENLATKARSKNDGLSSISQEDILGSFQTVCGFPADDRGLLLLQRLPGLGATRSEDGSRDFIDTDLVDAARAGDVWRFIEDPFSFRLENPTSWQATLGQLGTELAAMRCRSSGANQGKLRTAIQQAGRDGDQGALCMDLLQVSREMEFGYTGQALAVRNILVPDASYGDDALDFSKVSFHDCWFRRLEVSASAASELLPRFYECYVGTLDGRVSSNDLPEGIFDRASIIDSFGEGSHNTAAILALPLSTGEKVLLTVLKKLYLQPGAGRKQSALFRGLDHRARPLVPEVLDLLAKEGLTTRSSAGVEPIWLPMRSETVRVRRLVSSPLGSDDRLIQLARSIN